MTDQSHGEDSIASHLQYWILQIDESNSFMQIHLDTTIVSFGVACLMVGFALWLKGRLVAGAPTGAQNFIETVVGFIDDTVRDIVPVHNPLIAPLAFTVFVFIALINTLDILPTFLIGHTASLIAAIFGTHDFGWGIHLPTLHFRPVPTNDLNLPAAMAVSVFTLVLYYEFKLKPVHFCKELMFEPFTNMVPGFMKPIVMPINLILKLVEEFAKPLSLSFRLFGNMFAGEVVFLLIAFLLLSGGPVAMAAGFVVGLGWTFFHLLIGILQAFIFMILTVMYLSIAHQPVEH